MKGPTIKPLSALAPEPEQSPEETRSLLKVTQLIDYNECKRLLAMHVAMLPKNIPADKVKQWVRAWVVYVHSGGLLRNMGVMHRNRTITPVSLGKGLETQTLWLMGARCNTTGLYWRSDCDNGYKLDPYPDTWATRLVGQEMQAALSRRGNPIGHLCCEFSDLAALALTLPRVGPTFVFSTNSINKEFIAGGESPVHHVSIRSNVGYRVNHHHDAYGDFMNQLENRYINYAEYFPEPFPYSAFMDNIPYYLARFRRIKQIKKRRFNAEDRVHPDWFSAHAALTHTASPLSHKAIQNELAEAMTKALTSSDTEHYPCASACESFLLTSGVGIPVNTVKVPTKIGVIKEA